MSRILQWWITLVDKPAVLLSRT